MCSDAHRALRTSSQDVHGGAPVLAVLGLASVLGCRGLVWELLPEVHCSLLERSVSLSAADAVTLSCHCRPHRRRKDSHQQGPGGVPEPPADGGGPGHRGVHHALHCQSEAGGDAARGWAPVTAWLRLCTWCAVSFRAQAWPLLGRVCFPIACPFRCYCSRGVAWGRSNAYFWREVKVFVCHSE